MRNSLSDFLLPKLLLEMVNSQYVVVGLRAVVGPFLFSHNIIVESGGLLFVVVVAGNDALHVLQEGEEDSGLHHH